MTIKEECKDDLPNRTIGRIKKILAELGIKLVEQNLKSTSNTFTTKLFFEGTAIGSQGKGISRVLSRASAYAEFIERLQNMILAAPFHLSPEVLALGKFKFAPDEKGLTEDEVSRLEEDFGAVYAFRGDKPAAGYENGGSGGRSLFKWLDVFPGKDRSGFTGLPFCNLLDGRIRYIPWQMLALYRSNGMCAGNTEEEALVQGISEILERHVNWVAITESITPPDVPSAYFRRFKRPVSIMREIEKSGRYRVVVKDFSLGKDFPVLGVILISLEDKAYMVNFGAHPRFEIALERCFTEALQSYKVDSRLGKSLLPFSFLNKPVQSPYNYINSVRIGRGQYPAALFFETPDYEFKPWRDPGYDNTVMLRDLLQFVKGIGFSVLARDKSFLGFPAFQVLVPGMSEVEEPTDIFLPSAILRTEVGEIMRDIPQISAGQCDKLLSHITSRLSYMMECHALSGFLNFPVNKYSSLDSTSVPLFLAKLCCRKGDLARGHGIISSVVNRMGPADPREGGISRYDYLKCLRDYLVAAKDNISGKRISGVLRHFYPGPVVKKVLSEWGNTEDLLRDFRVLPCMDCQRCGIRRQCLKVRFLELYRTLKLKIADNPIEQGALRRFSLSA